MRLLIDADSLVYAAGFSADKQWREGEGGEKGAPELVPVSYALHSAKILLFKILDSVHHGTFDIYLSEGKTFRHELAKAKPYKGNRDKLHKPARFHEIREYMITRWQAEVIYGIEADDQVSIEAHKPGACVICSIDKDLDQIPGDHFNWRKGERYELTDAMAWRNLYTQILVGDPTDNVPGLPRVGKKTSAKLLGDLEKPVELYDACLKAYIDKGFTEEYLTEQASLLYLWRKYPDKWEKPV